MRKRLLFWIAVLFLVLTALIYYSGLPGKQEFLYQKTVELSSLDQTINREYKVETINLPDDYEGKVVATLLSRARSTPSDSAVVYIHGWADYFFHDHLARWFNERGFDFYAIELRKYGRSLLPHQKPNYCRNLDEYFPEMDTAIQRITKRDGHHYLMVCGHSTGGLTASLYAQSGTYKQSIKKLILNSPFLGFKADALTMNLLRFYGFLGKFNYNAVLPRAGSPLYTQTIHASEKGSWDFNFAWRPRTGFPFYQSWIHAIVKGQTQINQGSGIQCPVLVLTSDQSYSGEKLNAAAMSSDVVLDVPTIQKQATKLGKQITRVAIPGALHDVFLSPPNARKQAFIAMEKWLNSEQ